MALIKGRVLGHHKGRHVVLYALSGGRWWVQPFAYAPFTAIDDTGVWSARTHLGTEYAVLVTSEGFQPSSVLDSLPSGERGVEAIATRSGTRLNNAPAAPVTSARPLRFSGYDWEIRNVPGDYSAKTSVYTPQNVSLDDRGSMHLRVLRAGNTWTCAEVHTTRALGYGTYRFHVKNLGQLEPAAMFSTFTYAEDVSDKDHREMDMHVTRYGDTINKSAEYVVQPYFVPANVYRFDIPSGPLTTEMEWSPDSARFTSWKGVSTEGKPIASWNFTTGVPDAESGHVYINLCVYGYARIPPQNEVEVVVDQFEFFP